MDAKNLVPHMFNEKELWQYADVYLEQGAEVLTWQENWSSLEEGDWKEQSLVMRIEPKGAVTQGGAESVAPCLVGFLKSS